MSWSVHKHLCEECNKWIIEGPFDCIEMIDHPFGYDDLCMLKLRRKTKPLSKNDHVLKVIQK